jgi:hypothetical protein
MSDFDQSLTVTSWHWGIYEPVFLNIYGAQESIPRNEFRQPMYTDKKENQIFLIYREI